MKFVRDNMATQFAFVWKSNFGRPTPSTRRLDGVEVHKGPRNVSQSNVTHWLISTQVCILRLELAARAAREVHERPGETAGRALLLGGADRLARSTAPRRGVEGRARREGRVQESRAARQNSSEAAKFEEDGRSREVADGAGRRLCGDQGAFDSR